MPRSTTKSFGGDWLYVPLVGPFIAAAQTPSSFLDVVLAADGVAETAGLVLIAVGAASHKTLPVRDDTGESRLSARPALFGRSGGGLVLAGTF